MKRFAWRKNPSIKYSKNIIGITKKNLETEISTILPSTNTYRHKQIWEWIYKHKAKSFEDMTVLSKDLRNLLSENYHLSLGEIENVEKSTDGTQKFLVNWNGTKVECFTFKNLKI
jgi:23S rRNA (adenine2503-C2)-methyltransferase